MKNIRDEKSQCDINREAAKIHIFYISTLVTKGPGLNLGKKLSNLLSNREALNEQPTFYIFFALPKEICIAIQCNDFCLYYWGKVVKKKGFYIPNLH